MRKTTAEGASFEEGRGRGDDEVADGGADNVQKTSYVVGQGTDPDAPDPVAGVNANVRTGSGMNLGLVAVAVVAVLLALVYGAGLFT